MISSALGSTVSSISYLRESDSEKQRKRQRDRPRDRHRQRQTETNRDRETESAVENSPMPRLRNRVEGFTSTAEIPLLVSVSCLRVSLKRCNSHVVSWCCTKSDPGSNRFRLSRFSKHFKPYSA